MYGQANYGQPPPQPYGQPYGQPPPVYGGQQQQQQVVVIGQQGAVRPANYLALAIVVCLCCNAVCGE